MLGSTYLEILRDDLTNIYNYLLCSFQRTITDYILRYIHLCLRVFTDLSKPNNVRCQSVDLSDIQALGLVYVSLERR